MADTPEETIRAAAQAYIVGDDEGLMSQLHEAARVLGSEQRDNWNSRELAGHGLARELERRRTFAKSVGGSLLDQIESCGVQMIGDTAAWWSATGDLEVDHTYHRETSWTVVLRYDDYSEDDHEQGGDWKIVHSHFSIHR